MGQDRLVNCSDKHVSYACTRCGDMLLPSTERSKVLSSGQQSSEALHKARLRTFCRNPACLKTLDREEASDEKVEPVILPYVFRYLANELAAMNIKMKLEFKEN